MDSKNSSFVDDFFYSSISTPIVRLVAAVLLILVCTIGSIMNGLNFIAIVFRIQKRDGFLKICGLNSFGNTCLCIGYLCFPVPVLLIDSEPNHWLNAIMGQLIGWFAWSFAPLAQILLATNRITAVFMPHLHMKSYKYSPTNIGLILAWAVAIFLFLVLLPEGCHYLFNRTYVGWIGEVTVCTEIAQNLFFVFMFVIAGYTAICSVLLFVKLFWYTPEHNISNAGSLLRHRKNRRMIIQALIQSVLIIVDSLNSTVTYNLLPNVFFQFLTLSFSMVFLRTVEGFVVFTINNTIHAEVRKLLGLKNLHTTVLVPHRESMSTGTKKQLNWS